MKKVFMFAAMFAAVAFVACGGAQTAEDKADAAAEAVEAAADAAAEAVQAAADAAAEAAK